MKYWLDLFIPLEYLLCILFTKKEDVSYQDIWKSCEPFSNATVKRMLTIAHGTFCLVDAGNAVARGFVKGDGLNVLF